MSYFNDCQTEPAAKKRYNTLALANHPDRFIATGTASTIAEQTAIMLEIDAQYQRSLEDLHLSVSADEDGKERTYRYNAQTESAIIEFIDKLIRTGILDSGEITAELLGTWVWVSGKYEAMKDKTHLLNKKTGIGMSYIAKRAKWAFTPDAGRKFYSKKGYDSLQIQYGVSKIASDPDSRKALA